MKRLLTTLYVTTQGAYLSRDGETVRVVVDGETRLRVPIHTIDGVVCFGRVSCSPPLMRLCADNRVCVSFLSENGRFWARVQGPVSGNVLLRREQYRRADDEGECATIARSVLIAKTANCRTVLRRAVRDHGDTVDALALDASSRILARIGGDLERCNEVASLRGLEGHAAESYFAVFDHLIVARKDAFFMHERSRRPPLDAMNSLLSFLYTLLAHDVASALETVGLDPAVGFLHKERPGRPSLALDLMEEFRSVVAERTALSLVNRQQVKGAGFRTTETGAVLMTDETRKKVLQEYQKRKQEGIRHPFLNEKMPVGLLPHAQALLLARYLRGDLDGYPAFLWR